jgi:hypothetical protein
VLRGWREAAAGMRRIRDAFERTVSHLRRLDDIRCSLDALAKKVVLERFSAPRLLRLSIGEENIGF